MFKMIKTEIAEMLRQLFKDLYKVKNNNKSWDNTSSGKQLASLLRTENVRMSQEQRQNLDHGDVRKWDVSLLCLVLKFRIRNRSNYWNLSTDECDAIDVLRDLRNRYIGHDACSCIPTTELNNEVEVILDTVEILLKKHKNEKREMIYMVEKRARGMRTWHLYNYIVNFKLEVYIWIEVVVGMWFKSSSCDLTCSIINVTTAVSLS